MYNISDEEHMDIRVRSQMIRDQYQSVIRGMLCMQKESQISEYRVQYQGSVSIVH
jgi:hypothetical protein